MLENKDQAKQSKIAKVSLVVRAMIETVEDAVKFHGAVDRCGAYGYTAKSFEMSGIEKATEESCHDR